MPEQSNPYKKLLTGISRQPRMRPVFSDNACVAMSIEKCGAIAQLGERLHGMQEVSGSIPLSSTKIYLRPLRLEA